jgi:hypothetical protein
MLYLGQVNRLTENKVYTLASSRIKETSSTICIRPQGLVEGPDSVPNNAVVITANYSF